MTSVTTTTNQRTELKNLVKELYPIVERHFYPEGDIKPLSKDEYTMAIRAMHKVRFNFSVLEYELGGFYEEIAHTMTVTMRQLKSFFESRDHNNNGLYKADAIFASQLISILSSLCDDLPNNWEIKDRPPEDEDIKYLKNRGSEIADAIELLHRTSMISKETKTKLIANYTMKTMSNRTKRPVHGD